MQPSKRPRHWGGIVAAPLAEELELSAGEVLLPLRASMIDLWREKKMCDVDVVAGNVTTRAHSLVLASASVFFHTCFTTELGGEKSSVDSGAHPAALSPMLEFLYTGSCLVPSSLLVFVLETAEH